MILIGTHARLVVKNANVHRVDFPAVEVMGCLVPPFHEHFATRKQAEKFAENYGICGEATIREVPASDFDPWQDR